MKFPETVAEKLAEAESDFAAKIAEEKARRAILALLPGDMRAPTISNIGDASAWLSFSRPYSWDAAYEPTAVLAALELAGFEPMPCSLAWYGNYAPSVHAGPVEDLPETYSRAELKEANPSGPIWVTITTAGGVRTQAHCYYRKAGRVFRVNIDLISPSGYVTGKMIEGRGHRYYDRNSVTARCSEAWEHVQDGEGRTLYDLQRKRGQVSPGSDDVLQGEFVWRPIDPDHSMTPAEFLVALSRT